MLSSFTAEQIHASRTWLDRRATYRHAERETLRRGRLNAARRAITEFATKEPNLRAIWLFGSILRPGHFHDGSDIDVAIDCDDLQAESRFWSALEKRLGVPCDVRPLKGAVARAVDEEGERVVPAREGEN